MNYPNPESFSNLKAGHTFTWKASRYIKLSKVLLYEHSPVNAVCMEDGIPMYFLCDDQVQRIILQDVTGMDCDEHGRCTAT